MGDFNCRIGNSPSIISRGGKQFCFDRKIKDVDFDGEAKKLGHQLLAMNSVNMVGYSFLSSN